MGNKLLIADRKNSNSLKWDVKENELPMWVADMDFETAPCIKKAILKKANIGAYGYSIIPDAFFDSIIKWYIDNYNFVIKQEEMIYSSGIVAAISSIIRKCSSIGENILIQAPVFNIFYNCIYNNGRNIISNDLIYKDGKYEIDFVDLENKLSNPQTTLMILCNPHNPIGKIWSKEELSKIGKLCAKYNVLVISDEIHCEIVKPGRKYIPFASVNKINHDISITCISPSKSFNLAGLQSACIVVPNKFLHHKVWRGLNTDEIAEPNFFSMEANIAAFKDGKPWLEELKKYLFDNREYVEKYISKEIPRLKVIKSEATYLVWIDASYYTSDSVQMCKYIKEKTGLILCDGNEYGDNSKSFVRMNIATSLDNVKDGLNRLKDALRTYMEF